MTEPAEMSSDPAENLARRFHETYERLAPQHGYETREASAVPWQQVPANNRALMVAVAAEILEHVKRKAAQYLAAHPALHFVDAPTAVRAQHAAQSVVCAVGEVPYRPGRVVGTARPTSAAKPPPDSSWLQTPEVRDGDRRRGSGPRGACASGPWLDGSKTGVADARPLEWRWRRP